MTNACGVKHVHSALSQQTLAQWQGSESVQNPSGFSMGMQKPAIVGNKVFPGHGPLKEIKTQSSSTLLS